MWSKSDIDKTITSLSKVQRTLLTKKLKNETDVVSPEHAMVYWTADLLTWVKLVDPEKQQLIIETYLEQLEDFGFCINNRLRDNGLLPVYKIGIADRRYVTVSGETKALDLNSCEKVTILEQQVLETVNYNLTALYARNYAKLTSKDKSDARKHSEVKRSG